MKRKIAFGAIALTILAIIAAIILFPQEVTSERVDDLETPILQPVCYTERIPTEKIFRLGEENDLVQYAWELSEGDWDFILTVEGESEFKPSAVGDNGNSKGLCQWHQRWHKDVRNDPNFNDGRWQVEKCWEYFKGYREAGILHKRLFAYNYRQDKRSRFEVKTVDVPHELCE